MCLDNQQVSVFQAPGTPVVATILGQPVVKNKFLKVLGSDQLASWGLPGLTSSSLGRSVSQISTQQRNLNSEEHLSSELFSWKGEEREGGQFGICGTLWGDLGCPEEKHDLILSSLCKKSMPQGRPAEGSVTW